MVPSNIVLGTQIKNIKMRSSKLFIKSTSQKVMANVVLDVDFMILNILKLDFILFNVLEFIINLRATLRFFFGKTSI